MSNPIYNSNDEIFAQFDENKGWCFKGEKLGLEEFTPFSEVGHEHLKVLCEAFVKTGYPLSLMHLIYECYVILSSTVAMAEIALKELSGEESLESRNARRPHDMQLGQQRLSSTPGELSKVRGELADRFKAAFDGESEA